MQLIQHRAMRHAIYFTPHPESLLHGLGSTWLGRDAITCEPLRQPDTRLPGVTASPRRYGLHGTLKPPFRLKAGASATSFETTVRAIASSHQSFATAPLQLKDIDGFLALVPEQTSQALHDLADECVLRLDDFRAAPGEVELRQRRAVGLTAEQENLLQTWGYPYVFDAFRFHITLTEKLSDKELAWILPLADAHFAPCLGQALDIDAITIMLEPGNDEDFRVLERFPLISQAMRAA